LDDPREFLITEFECCSHLVMTYIEYINTHIKTIIKFSPYSKLRLRTTRVSGFKKAGFQTNCQPLSQREFLKKMTKVVSMNEKETKMNDRQPTHKKTICNSSKNEEREFSCSQIMSH